MAREGHSSGCCILKRGCGLRIILSKPVSTPPFLTQDKQHLTRKQLLLRMDASISELFCEETNLSPLPLLWLSRREMAAFEALSLYNWTVSSLKGQHAGNGSPFCSHPWHSSPEYTQGQGYDLCRTCRGREAGRRPKQVSSQSRQMGSSGYMPQGRRQNLVRLGFAQISREDLVISEN